MKNRYTLLLAAIVAATAIVACEPHDPSPDPQDTIPTDTSAAPHAIVLNEGAWGGNNASLSYLNLTSNAVVNNWFSHINGRGLGDVAQDLLLYGAKAYVTVWGSNSLEIIDTATGHSTHLDLGQRGPRYLAASNGKLYISCYRPQSVIRIDTATLQIEATCPLGLFHPEGLDIVGNTLLVASSNIADEQGNYLYDSIVYLIDLATFDSPTPLVVGCNPQKVIALDPSRAIVNYWGDYADRPAGSAIVDINARTVTQTHHPLSNMTLCNNTIYGYYCDYDAYWNKTTTYLTLDATTLVATPSASNFDINNPYAIAVHPTTGNLYIASDGNYTANGDLYCFSPTGTLLWKREVGMFPSKIIFL